ncbi:hypothetical protein CFK37_07130 [Virgibacillus phasianinus]|uniref:Uncharacterized protein n=1 Tax=Virgibacillus phasianinus TaxID=2017483 RepID=A0A220U1J7_9BACI|nr:hypothetical protein [Virgibacillus phasianinus]ASK61947.1 hypothetical protein CFK37_07130 [Virgibacillus phasianinus]
MNRQKDKRFDEFLSESFKDGACVRELRLTNAELQYVQLKFPKSKVTKLPETSDHSPKKIWYEVRIR